MALHNGRVLLPSIVILLSVAVAWPDQSRPLLQDPIQHSFTSGADGADAPLDTPGGAGSHGSLQPTPQTYTMNVNGVYEIDGGRGGHGGRGGPGAPEGGNGGKGGDGKNGAAMRYNRKLWIRSEK